MSGHPGDERAAPSRRAVLALLALLALLGVAGCSAIPTAGPVRAGSGDDRPPGQRADDPGYRVEPLGPLPGASPEDVVRGFYLADVGVDDDFAAARQFLSAQRRGSRRPTERTVVRPLSPLSVAAPVAAPSQGAPDRISVTVTTPVLGELDASGVYSAAAAGASLSLELHLVPARGQWRITDAPDLLLLDDPDFDRVYSEAALYFPSRYGSFLVPDERWVLDRSSTATSLVAALLAGPSSWLAPAVTSGAQDDATLGSGSVVVDDGEALVDLPQHFGDSPAASLRVLQQQLVATLSQLPEVVDVTVTVDGGDLPTPPAPVVAGAGDDLPALDDSAPVVLSAGRLARLSGGAATPVAGVPDLSGTDASHPALLDGQVAFLDAGGTQLQRVVSGRVTTVASGTALTPPSFDPLGWVWTTSAASTGTVTAISRSGRAVGVTAAWLAGRQVVSLRMAPDGARAVVASTGPGGDVRVDLAAVRRDADGTPTRLSAPQQGTTPWLAGVRAAVWVGEDDVAVLGTAGAGDSAGAAGSAAPSTAPSVWLLSAGRPRALSSPQGDDGKALDTVALAAGNGQRTLLAATADGRLWQLAGVDWAQLPVTGSDPTYPG